MLENFYRTLAAVFIAAVVIVVGATADKAQAAKMLCKDGHWHYGSSDSTPVKSKKKAINAAIYSWASFTAWEYGTEWAYFNRSADRKVSCEKHPGKRWTCSVEGRPCKRVK